MAQSTSFKTQLAAYKQVIDDDIHSYARHIQKITDTQYGSYAALETKVFLDMLSRGGKRIRGALVMVGYEMSGGTNKAMITQAARAIEMIHAYILILDDIQDRSVLRRGKPAAHVLFADYHRTHHLKGDADHFGMSMAINAAVAGVHAAEAILANMDADSELRLKVLSIANRTMAITAHGQTYDMMNSVVAAPKAADIERVLEWKTALYSFINPLHVGMVLANADCHATDAITPYARETGIAFQITDDILGVFGDEETLGKSASGDIQEGKATTLMCYAQAHAAEADAAFLAHCLGNPSITSKDLARCRRIIRESGALAHTSQVAQQHIDRALKSLEAEQTRWTKQGVRFLQELAQEVIRRQA